MSDSASPVRPPALKNQGLIEYRFIKRVLQRKHREFNSTISVLREFLALKEYYRDLIKYKKKENLCRKWGVLVVKSNDNLTCWAIINRGTRAHDSIPFCIQSEIWESLS